MADGEDLELLEVTSCPSTQSIQIITNSNVGAPVAVEEQVNDDFLHQAFVEAQDFESSSEQYDDGTVTQEMVNNVVSVANLVTSSGTTVAADGSFDGLSYTVVGEIPGADSHSIIDLQQNGIGVDSGTHIVSNEQAPEQEQALKNISELVDPDAHNSVVMTETPANVQFAPPTTTTSPLGSSHNPIRIIQQGNQYTPVQQLTAEQLQQIMQVVQQQQLAKTTADGGGSSVLFNSQTNTKIVYRVIYPSELHKSSASKATGQTESEERNSHYIHKRPYRKRNRDDDDDKVETPELTKEEKDAKKKQRPRTRSGRVSKPPKHMMKDYKHIHVLDWDEDYDDDDGGYSDFKCSDPEAEERDSRNEHQDELSLDAGYGPLRPKKFKCRTCDKSYIGQGGLGRHYRLCPSHGSLDEPEDGKEIEKSSENADGSIGSFSEDSNTQDSFPQGNSARFTSTPSNSTTQDSLPPAMEPVSGHDEISPSVTPQKICYGRRGRPRRRNMYVHETHAQRQKRRLREIVKASENEDLMEIVLPRLVDALTLWEFLLMKVEKDCPTRPQADMIYHEFEKLYKTVHNVCKKYLQPCKNSASEANIQKHLLKIDNSAINKALDLEEGFYEVKDMPMEESSNFQYTYLSSDKKPEETTPSQNKVRKTVTGLSGSELLSPAKKPKMTSLLQNTKSATGIFVQSNKQISNNFSAISSGPSAVTIIKPQTISSASNKTISSSSHLKSNAVTHIVPANASAATNVTANSLVQTFTQPPKPVFRVVSAQSSVKKPQEIPKSQESTVCKTLLVSTANNQSVGTSKNSSSGPVLIIGPNGAKLLNNPNIVFPSSVIMNGNNVNIQNKNTVAANKNLTATAASFVADSIAVVGTSVTKSDPCINGVTSQNTVLNGSSQIMTTSEDISTLTVAASENSELEKMANATVQEMAESAAHCISTNSTIQQEQSVIDVNSLSNYGDLQLQEKAQIENTQVVTMVQQGTNEEPCEILQLEGGQGFGGEVTTDFSQASLFQTEDGMYIIQNPDGMAFQLQGAEGIPIETVQALLSMESDAQIQGETVQTEMQQ